ncbi:hypothetical protein B0A49_03080 [Cryomyces minteri]|uniref:GPN-loop GTPase 2 n=1 Tax=Cryomyces minteri TaxID=331657 RepID=A0A4U0X217_9PEZI|nr:hypothetical protein B0A49_03080 [Cryomyces minteri]
MPFAQLIVGPPGSGKSTYCDGMHQFMGAIGRKCSVVNLDPANDHTSYPVALDIRDLVTLDEIMEAEELGPNGGVLYVLEELEHNIEWLEEGLKKLGDDYVLFDCPGQVELFTHHSSLRNIFFRLQKLGLYISSLLLALRSMLQLDLPHLNVLTKIDNLANGPPLPFNLDYYTEVQDLEYLLPYLAAEQPTIAGAEGAGTSKFDGLNKAIVELVEDFSLVGFETLAVEDKRSMMSLLRAVDRAGGYAFGSTEGANDTVWQVAMREGVVMDVKDVQERWIDRKEEFDELERKEWEEEAKARPPAEDTPAAGEHAEDDSDEDVESMKKAMADRGSGIKIVRKS